MYISTTLTVVLLLLDTTIMNQKIGAETIQDYITARKNNPWVHGKIHKKIENLVHDEPTVPSAKIGKLS